MGEAQDSTPLAKADVIAPIHVAYADPPYKGCSKAHYGDHPDFAGEVDQVKLLERLVSEYPDGWALSIHVPSLRETLNTCHALGADDVRVGSWVKPWSVWKPGMRVSYSWEPVIWHCTRKRGGRGTPTIPDFVIANAVMRRKNDPNQTKGTKPEKFCFWLFQILGLQAQDTLDDLYPGSGAVTEAWRKWKAQEVLPLTV